MTLTKIWSHCFDPEVSMFFCTDTTVTIKPNQYVALNPLCNQRLVLHILSSQCQLKVKVFLIVDVK